MKMKTANRRSRVAACAVAAAALLFASSTPANAATYSNVWGELNGDGLVVNYSTYRAHTASIQPRMYVDQLPARNFRLWFRNSSGTWVSDRAWFHDVHVTVKWHSPSGSATIPTGSYKLSGQLEGTIEGPFDPWVIRWQGDITM